MVNQGGREANKNYRITVHKPATGRVVVINAILVSIKRRSTVVDRGGHDTGMIVYNGRGRSHISAVREAFYALHDETRCSESS